MSTKQANHGYRYQVNYTKRFTSGILAGKLYHDHLRFVDWKSADQFRALCESGYEFAPCAGNSGYTVDDVSLFAIEEC